MRLKSDTIGAAGNCRHGSAQKHGQYSVFTHSCSGDAVHYVTVYHKTTDFMTAISNMSSRSSTATTETTAASCIKAVQGAHAASMDVISVRLQGKIGPQIAVYNAAKPIQGNGEIRGWAYWFVTLQSLALKICTSMCVLSQFSALLHFLYIN